MYSTMSPGPRPTSVPSGILIHPAVWPQLTWAEILPDRYDNNKIYFCVLCKRPTTVNNNVCDNYRLANRGIFFEF